jgi:malate synthase
MPSTQTTQIIGPLEPGFERILSVEATEFITDMTRAFRPRVEQLLAAREIKQRALDAGQRPTFPADTADIRKGQWRVHTIPPDLLDRRVEITGPTERKMIINALNSGASVFMADCEDSLAPTWHNIINGQINLRDAVDQSIRIDTAEKQYRLNTHIATLIVRPRGWHLLEKHWLVDGRAVPAAFVDFGLYLFHNHAELKRRGTGPYLYLPKLEGYTEARLWNDVFEWSEQRLAIESKTIKCTVLIETVLAAFELDEILYELKNYIVGLNCGRWDYIFSFIKKFNQDPTFVLPDRREVTMTTPFMRAYSLLVIQACHRRGALALGGMAAQIPIKNDPVANAQALAKVRADKEREASDGHDGTWVAHPGLVQTALDVFNRLMPTANNLDRLRTDVHVSEQDLLSVPAAHITEEGLRYNLSVAIQYIAAWLGGNGCVPIHHLMEDAATAEISRAQVWQWVKHRCLLADGRVITIELVEQLLDEELNQVEQRAEAPTHRTALLKQAATLVAVLTRAPQFDRFLTLRAYDQID